MKQFGIVLLIIVAICAGIAWWVTTSLDRTIARVIEEVGSDLLDSKVRVAGVETDLTAGRASIFGLTIANPTGEGIEFSKQPAFELDEITVAIDLSSLGEGPIPIEVVRVLAPRLNAEVTPGGINLSELRDRIGAGEPEEASAGDADTGEPIQLRVDLFEFKKGSIRADTEAVGGDVRDLDLPTVKLENLSGTPAEIGKQVLDVYLAKATKAVGAGRLKAEANKQLDKVKKKAKKKLGAAARSLLGGDE